MKLQITLMLVLMTAFSALGLSEARAQAVPGCSIPTPNNPQVLYCAQDANTCPQNCPGGRTFVKTVTRCEEFTCLGVWHHCNVSENYYKCAVTQPRPACNSCAIVTNTGPFIGRCAGTPPGPGGD